MSFTVVDKKKNGDSGGDYVLEVNVLENEGVSRDYLDHQYDYIEYVLDELYSEDRVPGTIARKVTTDADLSCDNVFDDGNNWLDDNSANDGLYLWCMDCNDNPFACCHESGWDGRHQAVSFSNYIDSTHGNCVAGIMEALHPYIYNKSCSQVIDEAGGEEDHYLGQIKRQALLLPDTATPMLGTYGQSTAENGDCSYWETKDGFTTQLTMCTKRAVEYSWNHAAGNH